MYTTQLGIKPAMFAMEEIADATFNQRISRVLRYLVARDGYDIVQRPQRRSGRRSSDYDFFYPDRHACGIVLYSRFYPGHRALDKGWFVSDRDFERLRSGLNSNHHYALIVYLFASGDVYMVNANIALQPANHVKLDMVQSDTTRVVTGIHVAPMAFRYVGGLLHPDSGDGAGPLDDSTE